MPDFPYDVTQSSIQKYKSQRQSVHCERSSYESKARGCHRSSPGNSQPSERVLIVCSRANKLFLPKCAWGPLSMAPEKAISLTTFCAAEGRNVRLVRFTPFQASRSAEEAHSLLSDRSPLSCASRKVAARSSCGGFSASERSCRCRRRRVQSPRRQQALTRANNSHTDGDTVDIDYPLGQEIAGCHGDWLRAALDSRILSLYPLVGHSAECKQQDTRGLGCTFSTVLPQLDIVAGDLTEGVPDLLARRRRLRGNTG